MNSLNPEKRKPSVALRNLGWKSPTDRSTK